MGQNRAFSAAFIFIALIFLLEIMSVGGRHLKFGSEKLNTYKTFLANETKVVKGGSRLHAADIEAADADMQSPVTAPSTPISVVGASQGPPPPNVYDFRPTTANHSPGVVTSSLYGAYGEATDAMQYPQPPSLTYVAVLDPKPNPKGPPAPSGNTPIIH